jgi:uncharacterized lipoprotein YmbA
MMKSCLAVLALALALSGCSLSLPFSGPARTVHYYVLSSPAPAAGQLSDASIGVLPVTMPGYLSRPQLVVRESDGVSIRINDFDRWGEEPSVGVARVLCETLASLGRSAVPLRTGTQVDSRLMLDVRRLDGPLDGDVTLDAVWTLQKEKKILRSGRFVARRAAGPTLESMVEAQSELVQMLARDIAGTLD